MSAQQQWVPPPQGSPTWIEIPAKNAKASQEFYRGLFPNWGWRPNSAEAEQAHEVVHYSFADTEKSGITGGIRQLSDGDDHKPNNGNQLIVYFYVNDLEEADHLKTKKAAERLGGGAASAVKTEPGGGVYMHLKDPDGNKFGIYHLRTSQ